MYRILICDDEKDIVAALKIYLQAEGYETLEAYNGEEALEIVENNDVHLILMDIMMPKMDGIEAMAKLREKYNIPILLLTAKSEETDKVLGLNVGADDYITKPFNPVIAPAPVYAPGRQSAGKDGNGAGGRRDTVGRPLQRGVRGRRTRQLHADGI